MRSKHMKTKGFTLIELMVTVAIVAILASIAIPSYRQYVLRAGRTDATAALLRIQTAEEKFFLQNNAYTATLVGAPPAGLGLLTSSENGKFDLGVALVGTGYLATATPNAASGQTDDTKCTSFTIDQNGTRKAYMGAADNTAECWK